MIPLADIPAPVLKFVVGFWRRKWIILAIAWLLALPGWLVVASLPDTYGSHAKIHVRTEEVIDQLLRGIAPRPDFQNRVDFLRLKLLTYPNLDKVAREVGIDLESRGQLEYERALRKLAADTQVRALRNNFLEIRYVSDDPVRAQQVVNGFLNIFIESDLSTTVSGMDSARAQMDRQIASFDSQINEKQRQIAEFRRQYRSELAEPTRLAQDIERMRETLRLRETQNETLTRQRDEAREELATTPRPAKATDPEILRLKEELLDLRSRYTDDYPRVIAIEERVDELERRLDSAGAVNPDYTKLQQRVEFLDEAIAELERRNTETRARIREAESSLDLAPAAIVDLDDITRGLENLEDKRRTLEDQRLALQISAGVGDSGEQIEYDIVEEPLVPLEPTGPPRVILTLLVLVAAAGAGAAAAFGLIILDRSYSQADELETAYEIPVLGSVSIVSATLATPKRLRELGLFAAGAAGLVLIALIFTLAFKTRETVRTAASDAPIERVA